MSARPLSDDEWLRTKEALDRNNWNQAAAARDLGESPSTIKSRVITARARKLIPDGSPLEGFRVKGTSTLYGADGEVTATWVKTDATRPSMEEIGVQVRAALDGYEPPSPAPGPSAPSDGDLVTVYP